MKFKKKSLVITLCKNQGVYCACEIFFIFELVTLVKCTFAHRTWPPRSPVPRVPRNSVLPLAWKVWWRVFCFLRRFEAAKALGSFWTFCLLDKCFWKIFRLNVVLEITFAEVCRLINCALFFVFLFQFCWQVSFTTSTRAIRIGSEVHKCFR